MFDSVVHAPSPTLDAAAAFGRTASPHLPLPHYAPSFRGLSPSVSSLNGSAFLSADISNAPAAESATALKTRVSELEVINDLFRGRVAELEASEAAARENEARTRAELEQCAVREQYLKRRVEELEARLNGSNAGNAGSPIGRVPQGDLDIPRKRQKMTMGDLIEADATMVHSRSATPLSMASSS